MLNALTLVFLAQASGFDSKVAWEPVSTEGGLTLEQRSVEATGAREFRVTAQTKVSVEALCASVFEWGTRGKDVPGLKARRELASAPDERVVYDQFESAVVSNRDYAITVRRTRGPDGVCRIRYWATNEKAPPVPDGTVRIERLWGSWTFTPVDGQTRLVYTQFSDPAGSIPAFLANGAQRDVALLTVRNALEKGKVAK